MVTYGGGRGRVVRGFDLENHEVPDTGVPRSKKKRPTP